jgi:predicted PurR-regulated permease PerM
VSSINKNKNYVTEHLLGLLVLFSLLIGGFFILKPFMTALMWSIVLGFSLWPAQRLLTKWFRGRRTLAAIFVAIIIAVLLTGPMILLGIRLAEDASTLGKTTHSWISSFPDHPPAWMERIPLLGTEISAKWSQYNPREWMERIEKSADSTPPKALPVDENSSMTNKDSVITSAQIDVQFPELIGKLVGFTKSWLPGATLSIGRGFVQILLSIILTFFILRDGQALGTRLKRAASRIAGLRGHRLMNVAGKTVRGVVYGIIGTAVAQGLLAGIGFAMAGVPSAVLLGVLTFFFSVVPFGPPLIWVPASLWLFSIDRTGWGIFLLIWGVFIVSSVDNIIKPYLISHGSKIPFIIVFMGVIGGALAFGLVGVFLGPTLLGVTYKIIEEWSSKNTLIDQINEENLASTSLD